MNLSPDASPRPIAAWRLLLPVLLVLLLAACASRDIVIQDKKIEYRQAYEVPQLEIPPDLTSSSIDDSMAVPDVTPRDTATYSAYAGERRTSGGTAGSSEYVLPDVEGTRVERLGDKRWLVVRGEPQQVWGPMRQFWLQLGFLVAREDAQLGILETEWAENRADIPSNVVRDTLTKLPFVDSLYDSDTRDKFRVRLEKGATAGTTEVYLVHRGLEKVAKGPEFVWQPRPSDPEIEAELLTRMMMFWGAEEERARQQVAGAQSRPDRSRMVTEGDSVTALMLAEDFARAWRRAGVALDRIGFAVEDRDRSRGAYRVRYQAVDTGEKEGFFSKLAFWKDDKPDLNYYNISLRGYGEETRVEVLDDQNVLVSNTTAQRILTLLHEELR
ncbi:MAG TPA: outer membrane protein assembly factor BamC [Gammaproteobacteria bacterium]